MPYKDPATQSRYQAEWSRRRRNEWIAEHGPCQRCDSWDNLEVDHIDGSGKVTHRVWFWSEARREAELAKCQVLCESCHATKTGEENRQRFQGEHGGGKYGIRRCSCDLCKIRKAAYMRDWRRARAGGQTVTAPAL